MQRYAQNRAYRDAHALALSIHRATASCVGPRDGAIAQLRRTALAVPTSIVEGWQRRGEKLRQTLDRAESALAETEYLLVFCRDLGYLRATVTDPLIRTAPELARGLRTLRSFASDITPLESAMPDVSDLADIFEVPDPDHRSASSSRVGGPSPRPTARARTSKPTAARRAAQGRKAIGARGGGGR